MDLDAAICFAVKCHQGQRDKGGAPYILHPLRVMLAQSTDEARIVGVLHDVVEDYGEEARVVIRNEWGSDILEAVLSVTRREGEAYDPFIRRANAHPIGRLVKLADLRDNCDLTRIANPTPADFRRVRKYQAAIRSMVR